MRNQKKKEEKKDIESIFKELTAENFQNLEREMDIQIHEPKRFQIC